MPRNEVIEFKVTAEEKESIRSQAAYLKVPVSVFVRSCALREHLKKEERAEALSRATKAVENDPSNLNATLDEKGSVAIETGAAESDRQNERKSWIDSTARILMMEKGLSKVAATMEASKEWNNR